MAESKRSLTDDGPVSVGGRMAYGSSEEGRRWVGRQSALHRAEVAVNEAMIRNYCALLEDSNPRFWDGGEGPPGMMQTWGLPLVWRPDGEARPYMFALEVPLPGTHLINASVDTEFYGRVYVGDRVWVREAVADVSDEKRTRLGRGHFITTTAEYFVTGNRVAASENVLFRYKPGASE
jgi:uncharacterized protein